MMNKKDAEKIIKDLSEKPFVCSEHCIETESGYVITTKEKQKYARSKKQTNADRIRNMSDEELADFLHNIGSYVEDGEPLLDIYIGMDEEITISDDFGNIKEWLQAEVKEGNSNENT